jgi:prophage maintenance system killer protein
LLESAVLRPQNGYYRNLIGEASALMESLANNQAFIDGNKRVSFVMTDAMLRANGYFDQQVMSFDGFSYSRVNPRWHLLSQKLK